jgi:hypothetical protein
MKQEQKTAVVSIFHKNVQIINNELVQLNAILQTELEEVEVLCPSEHCLSTLQYNRIKYL